jgi:hypothetical protein
MCIITFIKKIHTMNIIEARQEIITNVIESLKKGNNVLLHIVNPGTGILYELQNQLQRLGKTPAFVRFSFGIDEIELGSDLPMIDYDEAIRHPEGEKTIQNFCKKNQSIVFSYIGELPNMSGSKFTI